MYLVVCPILCWTQAKFFRYFWDLPSDWLSSLGSKLGVHNFLVMLSQSVVACQLQCFEQSLQFQLLHWRVLHVRFNNFQQVFTTCITARFQSSCQKLKIHSYRFSSIQICLDSFLWSCLLCFEVLVRAECVRCPWLLA